MIGLIFAATAEGVIGKGGKIPWRYPGDFKRFKRITMGSAIIMGRVTWESIGKPLDGRVNIVVTSRSVGARPQTFPPGVIAVADIGHALIAAGVYTLGSPDDRTVWFIGGAAIYEAAMPLAGVIDETRVPDEISVAGAAVVMPRIDTGRFEPGPWEDHEEEPRLRRRIWTRVRR
jgi:dihydrofolate reductase